MINEMRENYKDFLKKINTGIDIYNKAFNLKNVPNIPFEHDHYSENVHIEFLEKGIQFNWRSVEPQYFEIENHSVFIPEVYFIEEGEKKSVALKCDKKLMKSLFETRRVKYEKQRKLSSESVISNGYIRDLKSISERYKSDMSIEIKEENDNYNRVQEQLKEVNSEIEVIKDCIIYHKPFNDLK